MSSGRDLPYVLGVFVREFRWIHRQLLFSSKSSNRMFADITWWDELWNYKTITESLQDLLGLKVVLTIRIWSSSKPQIHLIQTADLSNYVSHVICKEKVLKTSFFYYLWLRQNQPVQWKCIVNYVFKRAYSNDRIRKSVSFQTFSESFDYNRKFLVWHKHFFFEICQPSMAHTGGRSPAVTP